MFENLAKLYNTLLTVETKGESSKTMADCLRYLEGLISEEKNRSVSKKETEKNVEKGGDK